ncbi:MAG: stage II sporulation protein M [Theionarchaea archaeon]|nr:stage II sporulation protein M [Theionarchaea archaeon]MBU7038444.1 stage II sporulation protein M [Theionarchaea archaeon]
MKRRINWMRVISITGLALAFLGIQIIFTSYTLFDTNFDHVISMLIRRGAIETVVALLLFVVVAKNTTLHDIKVILHSLRVYVVLASLFLLLGFVAGIFLQEAFKGLAQTIFEELAREAEKIQSIPSHYQVLVIFGNNSRVTALSGIVSGIIAPFFLVGVLVPPVVMGMNGFILGFAPGLVGMSWSDFMIAIAPHGIFEIPALVLSAAVGLKFAISVLQACIGYLFPPPGVKAMEAFLDRIRPGWYSLKLFALIIPLLVVAAFVEAYVTPQIMELFGIL